MPRLTPDAIMHTPYYVHGDVDIDGEAAIAPGVILVAEPGSRLIIARGTCVGADAIIRARQGNLVIEPEASIGSGALVVGWGRIGAQACVGSGSTLLNPQLPPRTLVAPRTLTGEPSRSAEASSNGLTQEGLPEAKPEPLIPEEATSIEDIAEANGHNSNGNGSGVSHVYGREQVQQLLETLFPHRQALGTSPPARTE
ncbi:MAG TPA: hypothetical protein V6D29_16960 [Leptolyngbyaceae cyanobacterium]